MADAESQNAQQTNQKLVEAIQFAANAGFSFAGGFVGALTAIAGQSIIKNKAINDRVKDQSDEARDKADEFHREADALPEKELAGYLPDKSTDMEEAKKRYALTKTNEWWDKNRADQLPIRVIDNRDVAAFESKMSANGLDYELLPFTRRGEGRSYYLTLGEDDKKISIIAHSLKYETYIDSPQQANEFFHNNESKFVRHISGFSNDKEGRSRVPAADLDSLRRSLDDDGIGTYLLKGKDDLIIRDDDCEKHKDLIQAAVTSSIIMGQTRMQSRINTLQMEGPVKADGIMQDIFREGNADKIKDKSFSVYDAAFPDNFTRFIGGGAVVYRNGEKVKGGELAFSDKSDQIRAAAEIKTYVFASVSERDLRDMTFEEKVKPFAEFSTLNHEMAVQEQHMKEELLRQLKLSARQVETEHKSGPSPVMIDIPEQSVEAFTQDEDKRDSYDVSNIAEQYGIKDLKETVLETQSPDKAQSLVSKAQTVGENITISGASAYELIPVEEQNIGELVQGLVQQIAAIGGKEKDKGRDIIDRDNDGIDDRDEDRDGDGVADAYDDHDDRNDAAPDIDEPDIDPGDFDDGLDPSDFE